MKKLLILFVFISQYSFAQLTIEKARESVQPYYIGSYSYHEQFIGYKSYGAPIILTSDGGAAVYGDGEVDGLATAVLVKLDSTGKEQWKAKVKKAFDEMESQSVVEDDKGNFYVFMLSYDHTRYRGGSERVVCFDKTGKQLWDKTLGKYTLLNNPTISYIRNVDGKIYLRGHIATEKPEGASDPLYNFWEGWLDEKGNLTQKNGTVIKWEDQTWQEYYKPEKE